MVIFSVVGTKGGIGKTTLTANLSALTADMGLRVLMVDADIQASLTKYFQLRSDPRDGLTSVILNGRVAETAITPTMWDRLDIIVCDAPRRKFAGIETTDLEQFIQGRIDAPMILRRALRSPMIEDHYDLVFVDTPGAQGPLLYTAALAAHRLISPIMPETPSAREFRVGTIELLQKLDEAQALGISPGPLTAVLNRVGHTNDARQITDEIRTSYLDMKGLVTVAETIIPASVAYNEAATAQLPVHRLKRRDRVSPFDTMHELVWEMIPSLRGVYAGGYSEDGGE
ncbi:ParA family protein [Parasulfuritortus cantonensis]|uniref:ParA family protein n=1 Tax=Parasulfuritortus cantonensis TaxID=2528202 RepID=A0A4R1BDJ5_9PROT|nr:ParA family protein [Parasulfuritortus cantonensis]TCJ15186.1 ParA family protein [Parasulfuritortus cantonensis]